MLPVFPALRGRRGGLLIAAAGLLALGGCLGSSGSSSNPPPGEGGTTGPSTGDVGRASDALRDYPLDSLPTTTVSVGAHTFRVWLAQEFDDGRPGVIGEGLMYVRPDEIEDDQGMFFVFSDERVRSFWMANTLTPLDIAFVRFDGTIVTIRQMPPLTLRTFSSFEPVMFALEVKQGTFATLGIEEGDVMEIPTDVFDVRK